MSDNTEKRYTDAGMRPPAHDERISPELHHIDPELQPVDDPTTKTKSTASRKRSSTTTQKES